MAESLRALTAAGCINSGASANRIYKSFLPLVDDILKSLESCVNVLKARPGDHKGFNFLIMNHSLKNVENRGNFNIFD